METNINIAEILKDKPQNTKLYSPLFGDVYLLSIQDGIITVTHHGGITKFFKNGKYYCYPESEPLLFPSKEMHDWRKYAWKKGDVLVSSDGIVEVIFEKFTSDTYQSFIGKHHLDSLDENPHYQYGGVYATAIFNTESKDATQTYINNIEKCLDGKLNLQTLKIEKLKPEFKDGDIVVTDPVPSMCYSKCILILKGDLYAHESCTNSYVFYNINNNRIIFNVFDRTIRDRNIHLATKLEKQQLFNALAKEGNRWDSEKKEVVDFKPKIELKPFDKVLVRDGKNEIWEPAFFFRNLSHLNVYNYQTVGGESRVYCIPFNEETAKLIGTTDDWEG